MTDLTEKWKKGELPDGFYYFKLPDGSTDIASEYKMIRYRLTKDSEKIEILASVPSYEEYLESEAHCAVYSEENKLLKQFVNLYSHETEVTKQLYQLLEECKEYLSDVDTYCTKNADESYLLITRINAAIGESEE